MRIACHVDRKLNKGGKMQMRLVRLLSKQFHARLTLLDRKHDIFLVVTMALGTVLSLFLFYVAVGKYTKADDGQEHITFPEGYFDPWPGYKVQLGNSMKEDIPIIVWWADGGSLNHHMVNRHQPFAHVTCPNGASCYSVTDRDPKLMADPRTRGMLFYGTDLDPMDLPLPRLKHHEWALIHEESPLNQFIIIQPEMMRLFNHTSTFMRASDYPISTQAIQDMDYLFKRQPVNIAEKNAAKKARGLASVVYVQSHCDVPSDRDSYVKELMKYIAVDSYGSCLHNKDLPAHLLDPAATFGHSDFLDLLSAYKFNLAFENAYCNDYMTEKIMRCLHVGVVPIYKGSPVIQDWMPNKHSVILVDDFVSPKELADFINYLDQNDTEYEKYLEFKTKGNENTFLADHMDKREWGEGSMKNFFRGFECYVCKELTMRMKAEEAHKLNNSFPLPPAKIASPFHLSCPAPERLDIGQGRSRSWPQLDWTSMYWDGVDSAIAVQTMLREGETDPTKFKKYKWQAVNKHQRGGEL